ncbi:MAG TPA: hypothetical protein VJ875_08210 [Pyrinomonadaceae bacterium]|nr:hypothetical protein [Pyrinomonadaceae bacterium]
MHPALLSKHNRGLLLDIVVFVLNLFLMRWLTSYVVELFRFADAGEPLAQFALSLACLGMWVLPAAGAVLKRWHFHRRLKSEGRSVDPESSIAGCLFNPIFYFCLNLVLVSAILTGLGRFLFGKKLLDNGAVFIPLVVAGLICTILQTFLIYRYFSAPKKPPRSKFLRDPESETVGDICIFLNMILFQIAWNLLAFAGLPRVSGPVDFALRLFFLSFIALLIYFPPRMFYLVEDINRGRTWLTMLLANSPVLVRVLLGTNEWS